jgi:uncharacterized membrane protein YcaP (DUF421 family)
MFRLPPIDWHTLLVPSVSPLELVLRGSVMYLLIFAAMRILRRQRGALTTADLLVVVMVADAAQNALASDHRSLPEGVILISTIFAWNFAIDWLGYRSVRLHRVLNPSPLLLVEDGKLRDAHLRQELLTREDLDAALRAQGVEQLHEVRLCYLESNGHISVIKRSGEQTPDADAQRTLA